MCNLLPSACAFYGPSPNNQGEGHRQRKVLPRVACGKRNQCRSHDRAGCGVRTDDHLARRAEACRMPRGEGCSNRYRRPEEVRKLRVSHCSRPRL